MAVEGFWLQTAWRGGGGRLGTSEARRVDGLLQELARGVRLRRVPRSWRVAGRMHVDP